MLGAVVLRFCADAWETSKSLAEKVALLDEKLGLEGEEKPSLTTGLASSAWPSRTLLYSTQAVGSYGASAARAAVTVSRIGQQALAS